MDGNHPITPPPELLSRWEKDWHYAKVKHIGLEDHIAHQAARWGSDQELEACVEWLRGNWPGIPLEALRSARRPEPPSLKEQALKELRQLPIDPELGVCASALDTIRRALEQLND